MRDSLSVQKRKAVQRGGSPMDAYKIPIRPFITFLTFSAYPELLPRCMESVKEQTAVDRIEHIIVPDYQLLGVGKGSAAKWAGVGRAATGQYIHILDDDDVLTGRRVVEELIEAYKGHRGDLPVMTVNYYRENKHTMYPAQPMDERPKLGHVCNGNYIYRWDVFQAVAPRVEPCYVSDWGLADLAWTVGYHPHHLPIDFSHGKSSHGGQGGM